MPPQFTYVIEHMEQHSDANDNVPEWVQLEYKHMLALAGENGRVLFTALPKQVVDQLSATLATVESAGNAASFAVHNETLLDLLESYNTSKEKICLLDPKAERELSPEDGDGRFDMLLFGGILGDDPPRDRTGELRVMGFPTRRLGPVQMTTDTALGVSKRIVADGEPLESINYVDFPNIRFNAQESIEMPFRYMTLQDKKTPILPPGMKEHLYKDLDRGLEFD